MTARRLRSRAAWGIADQLVSSAANFAVLAIAAKTAGLKGFGAFAVAYAVYSFALGVGRAVGGEVLLLRAGEAPEDVHRQSERLLGLAAVLALLGSALLLAASLLVTPVLAGAFRALALVLPFLLVQDALRYCCFAAGRPRLALADDALWTAAALGLLGLVLATQSERGAGLLILAWGAGAALALIPGLMAAGLVPRPRQLREWLVHDRRRVGSFLADFLLVTGSFLAALQGIGLIAGLAAVAAVQGAQLLFAPFAALTSGARVLILPSFAQAARATTAELRRRVHRASGALYAMAAAWAALVLLIPDGAGRALLGPAWRVAEPLLPWTALYWVARTGALPALDGLRALGGGRRLVVARAQSGVLILAGALAGAALNGALGASIGLAAALCASVALWWLGFSAGARTHTPARAGAVAEPVP